MRQLLRQIAFDVIKNSERGITKSEITKQVVDYAWNNNLMTRELSLSLIEIGWEFQKLKKFGHVDNYKIGRQHFWFSV
jgi:predicted transcriptional regulator